MAAGSRVERSRLLGVGGWGGAVVDLIAGSPGKDVELAAADSGDGIRTRKVPTKLILDLHAAGGPAAGDWLAQTDLAALVVGLGGRIGTHFAPAIALQVRRRNRLMIAFAILPPREPTERFADAIEGLDALVDATDAVVVVRSSIVTAMVAGEGPGEETAVFTELIRAVVELPPSPRGASLEDLGRVFRAGGLTFAGHGKAAGGITPIQATRSAIDLAFAMKAGFPQACALLASFVEPPRMSERALEKALSPLASLPEPVATMTLGSRPNSGGSSRFRASVFVTTGAPPEGGVAIADALSAAAAVRTG